MRVLLLLPLCLLVLAVVTDASRKCKRKRPCPQVDPAKEKKICASNGEIYKSKCELKQAKCDDPTVERVKCKKPCTVNTNPPCRRKGRSVCGKDGVTYRNRCLMKANCAEFEHPGECKIATLPTPPPTTTTKAPTKPPVLCMMPLIRCANNSEPVCGKDDKTYASICEMRQHCVQLAYNGKCCDQKDERRTKSGLCCKQNTCNRMYSPVCGKDGKTYSNRCVMENACTEFQHPGECKIATLPTRPPTTTTKAPTKPPVQCIVPLMLCLNEGKPVCGKDDKTYTSMCEMRKHCVQHAYDGKCCQKDEKRTRTGQCCKQSPCNRMYSPVCGKDGKTYSNRCVMDNACTEFQHPGECKQTTQPPTPPPTTAKATTKPPVQCIQPLMVCANDGKPVCGKDNKTYTSMCEMRQHCVQLAHEGQCCEQKACNRMYSPVCGKDGKTYSNKCVMENACVQHAFDGQCPCQKDEKRTESGLCCKQNPCLFMYSPVCGKDGKTYSNRCVMENACVQYAYGGQCCEQKDERRTESGLCCIQKACPRIYRPVCGKDGKTYSNGCVMESACVQRAHDGQCCQKDERRTESGQCCKQNFCNRMYSPVCGKDGKTYSNRCGMDNACTEFDYDGPCHPIVMESKVQP